MTDKPTRLDAMPAPPSAEGHALRPDPAGHADPIGVAAAGAGDFTLRPDPLAPEPSGAARPAEAADALREGVQGTADRAADLAGQARERVAGLAGEIQGRLQERLSGAAEDARTRASAAYDDARSRVGAIHRRHMRRIDDLTVQGIDGLNRGKGAVERFVDENPLLVGVVGVAAGLLLGALLPRTRQEDENLGPWADEVRDQGLRYAREVTSMGREFVRTALDPDNLNAAARRVGAADAPPPAPEERTTHTP